MLRSGKLMFQKKLTLIKQGACGGTYFKNILCCVNQKWYKKSWQETDQLKNIDQQLCCSDYDGNVNKCGVKYGTSLRFWEDNGRINKIGPYGWFQ